MYRIGPRFNASVTRLDPRVDPRAERRYSVDSGLAQVIRVGGASAAAAGPRTVRLAPVRYADDDDQLQASQTAAVPQVTGQYLLDFSCLSCSYTTILK